MADSDAFSKVSFSDLDANSRSVMEANARSQGISAEQYYESRGGVNKAGYYGDSYKPGITLNDDEYFAAIESAKQSGASGAGIGGAINAASDAKRKNFMSKMGFTNEYQLRAYLNGTSELAEKMLDRDNLAERLERRNRTGSLSGITPVPAPSATPPTPTAPDIISPPPPPVKTAPLDTILYEEDPIPVEIMADLIFENIGGQELINISRNDLINGQKVIYQPIKNLNSIQQEYNPNNIVALQNTSSQIFNNFPIKIESKVPNFGSGPNDAFVYIDPTNGDLVVECINLDKDEQVEVQIIQDGTIYEEEL